MKKIILITLITLFLFVNSSAPNNTKKTALKTVNAEELDYQCMGQNLSTYMNTVIEGAKGLPNVKLLSPVFNMTSYTFDNIVNSMADNGAKFDQLDGIAGNVYNLDGQTITGYLDEKLDNPNIAGLPVYITETGMIDVERNGVPRPAGITNLAWEVEELETNVKYKDQIKAVLLFNSFSTNPGFQYNVMTDPEIRQVCSGTATGSCTTAKVGINSAAYFYQGNIGAFYGRAQNLGMTHTLEIATKEGFTSAMAGIQASHGSDLTPIVRIGVGDDSGGFDNPEDYVEFIANVSQNVSQDVYFIAGPNEPDLEYWLFKDCSGMTSGNAETQRPLTDFKPLTIACDASNPPDGFHPLRPYPANACDPLIPMSKPKAGPETFGPDYKKYITYSCAPPLTPLVDEAFDPYGNNISGQAGVDGYTQQICTKVDLHVTCYRTEAIDLTVDLKDANLGILGNTQDQNITDEQKVNNYLSYYLTGVPQVSNQQQITNEKELDKLVNLSGPLRKLLPWDLQNSQARTTIIAAEKTGIDVHNYKIGSNGPFGKLDQHLSETNTPPDSNDPKYKNNPENYQKELTAWRFGKDSIVPNLFGLDPVQLLRQVFDIQTISSKLFQNIPLSSVEDTAGEYVLSIFGQGHQRQDPNVINNYEGKTAHVKLVTKGASLASGEPGSANTLPSTYTPPKTDTNSINCTEELKIMPVGDSITVGITKRPDFAATYPGYRGFLYQDLTSAGYKIDYVGANGDKYPNALGVDELPDDDHEGHGNTNTQFMLSNISTWLNQSKPDIVLLNSGTVNLTCIYKDLNDPTKCDTTKTAEDNIAKNVENIGKIIKIINQSGSKTYLAKITIRQDYPDEARLYNQKLEAYAKEAIIVDLQSAEISSDLVHPTEVGYKTIANAWSLAIKSSCK